MKHASFILFGGFRMHHYSLNQRRTRHPIRVTLLRSRLLYEYLDNCDKTLALLDKTPETYLAVLLSRDRLETEIRKRQSVQPQSVQKILELDNRLRESLRNPPSSALTAWRKVMHPPTSAWWWYLDQHTVEQQQSDLMWNLLTGTFMVLAAFLATEIIKRLWENSPDVVSVWGTMLILLLSASPFAEQGQSIVKLLLNNISSIKTDRRSKIMAAAAVMVFVVLLITRLWILPEPLATYYNNAGAEAWAAGDINLAAQRFQRSAILNPNRVVPYNNLARAYQNSGLMDQAVIWYQKAVEQNAKSAQSYLGLGEIYNQQGKYADAEEVLLTGLSDRLQGDDEVTRKVTQYELLANLGQSYWGQNKQNMAQMALEAALALEPELKMLGEEMGKEYRLALPHLYLAQIYENAGNTALARQQWEDSLRFLDQADWRQQERYLFAEQHLQNLEDK
jgi:tetratricopeptide (TPR) repeat protein